VSSTLGNPTPPFLLVNHQEKALFPCDSFSMSFVMLSLQVMRIRPILRDPSGIQLSACFARLPPSIRCTWPHHRNLCSLIFVNSWSCPVSLRTLSFLIFSCQEMFRTRRRHLSWAASGRLQLAMLENTETWRNHGALFVYVCRLIPRRAIHAAWTRFVCSSVDAECLVNEIVANYFCYARR